MKDRGADCAPKMRAEIENGMDETVSAVNYGAKGQIGEGGFRAL